MESSLEIRGARVHNLKNIHLDIPRNNLVDAFSTFAQRRLPKLSRNLGTAIACGQKRLGRTLRSTEGTVTEIHTYLRLLWSRSAQPFLNQLGFQIGFAVANRFLDH